MSTEGQNALRTESLESHGQELRTTECTCSRLTTKQLVDLRYSAPTLNGKPILKLYKDERIIFPEKE